MVGLPEITLVGILVDDPELRVTPLGAAVANFTGVLRQREWDTTDGDKRYAYEVDATEVGVSLKWATVKVAKAACATTSGSVGRWGDKPPL